MCRNCYVFCIGTPLVLLVWFRYVGLMWSLFWNLKCFYKHNLIITQLPFKGLKIIYYNWLATFLLTTMLSFHSYRFVDLVLGDEKFVQVSKWFNTTSRLYHSSNTYLYECLLKPSNILNYKGRYACCLMCRIWCP